ncbi:MAG: hypothetical protein M3Q08_05215 [Pseudomonadota bacterium]|nr:hypothetical protein [Pseudomonadota bacterium]
MAQHPLRVDDVLDIVSLERAVASPDGEWVAAVVQRPARPGEAFGRAAYEVDPSRSDIWLVSRRHRRAPQPHRRRRPSGRLLVPGLVSRRPQTGHAVHPP